MNHERWSYSPEQPRGGAATGSLRQSRVGTAAPMMKMETDEGKEGGWRGSAAAAALSSYRSMISRPWSHKATAGANTNRDRVKQFQEITVEILKIERFHATFVLTTTETYRLVGRLSV